MLAALLWRRWRLCLYTICNFSMYICAHIWRCAGQIIDFLCAQMEFRAHIKFILQIILLLLLFSLSFFARREVYCFDLITVFTILLLLLLLLRADSYMSFFNDKNIFFNKLLKGLWVFVCYFVEFCIVLYSLIRYIDGAWKLVNSFCATKFLKK